MSCKCLCGQFLGILSQGTLQIVVSVKCGDEALPYLSCDGFNFWSLFGGAIVERFAWTCGVQGSADKGASIVCTFEDGGERKIKLLTRFARF